MIGVTILCITALTFALCSVVDNDESVCGAEP